MKVYIYYQHKTKTQKIVPPRIYGFTDDKEIAKKFELTRDMDQFHLKKVKMSTDEYKMFSYKYGQCYLKLSGFSTNIKNFGKDIVFLVTTELEEEQTYLKADNILKELAKYTLMDGAYFNTDILKALNKLNYFALYKFYSMDEYYLYNGFNPTEVNHFDLGIEYDMLNLFFYFYGNTMNMKLKVD